MKSQPLYQNTHHDHPHLDKLRPRNWPISPTALFLALGLIAAGLLYFLPVFLNPGMNTDQQTVHQAINK